MADFVAESEAMKQVLRMVERVAPTDASVLIRGENGTGKELIAQALHSKSHRGHRALVAVDLGAVAESLFESELFGHKQGAFTDADRDRAGRFQAAHEGTLFLDEIGNLTLPLQNKLLRVLESCEVTPLGGDKTITVDVRLISATNQPLDNMVTDGRFREDLLYRINTIEIVIPPLRERLEDIPPLVEFFTSRTAKKYRLNHKSITPEALELLTQHHWPGNVRELSHAVERALILSDKDVLDVSDFALTTATTVENLDTLNLEQLERRTISLALERANGNISHAAKALGITRNALYRRIEKFGL